MKQEAHGQQHSPEKPVQISEYIQNIYIKTDPIVQEEEIFKILWKYFCNFVTISQCKRRCLSI